MKTENQTANVFAIVAMGSPNVDAFKASSSTDSEIMLRQADELEQSADMLCRSLAGTRLMRSQAVALRKLARKG